MKTNWLITTAAVAILAATGLAAAQGMNEKGAKAPSAMEKSAPAKSPQGAKGSAQTKGSAQMGTTGQAPAADSPSKQPPGAMQQKQQKSGSSAQKNDTSAPQKSGSSAQKNGMQQKQGADAQKNTQQKSGTAQKNDMQHKQGADAQKGTQQKGAQKAGAKSETTGRGDTSGASLTAEQKTKIRQVVVSKKIPKTTNVNFSISVGARVPRTVHFYPIPVEIVEIHPAWRGYRVILVGSELIIVSPSTFEIVAVIAV
jgi:hypothetical protein